MDNKRRTFLKNAALASSALAVSKTVSAQDADSTGFLRIATEETFSIPEVIDATTSETCFSHCRTFCTLVVVVATPCALNSLAAGILM